MLHSQRISSTEVQLMGWSRLSSPKGSPTDRLPTLASAPVDLPFCSPSRAMPVKAGAPAENGRVRKANGPRTLAPIMTLKAFRTARTAHCARQVCSRSAVCSGQGAWSLQAVLRSHSCGPHQLGPGTRDHSSVILSCLVHSICSYVLPVAVRPAIGRGLATARA